MARTGRSIETTCTAGGLFFFNVRTEYKSDKLIRICSTHCTLYSTHAMMSASATSISITNTRCKQNQDHLLSLMTCLSKMSGGWRAWSPPDQPTRQQAQLTFPCVYARYFYLFLPKSCPHVRLNNATRHTHIFAATFGMERQKTSYIYTHHPAELYSLCNSPASQSQLRTDLASLLPIPDYLRSSRRALNGQQY